MLEHALSLARRGFYVFPIKPGAKTPPLVKFKEAATRDEAQIRVWFSPGAWGSDSVPNIGIYTGRYGNSEAILACDIDNKGAKRGDDEIIRLELEGKDFPETYTQSTPTGGRHLVYRVPAAVKQGVNVLGSGLDIRSRGGFIVAAGSRTSVGPYVGDEHAVAAAPGWLIASCADVRAPVRPVGSDPINVPAASARDRAVQYLENRAPLAVQGDAGDATTFAVAAGVRDFGVSREDAAALLSDHWNERCSPPWSQEELERKVANAYAYAQNAPGVRSPESVFPPSSVGKDIPGSSGMAADMVTAPGAAKSGGMGGERDNAIRHPFDVFDKHAYLSDGDLILWRTTDPFDQQIIKHMSLSEFRNSFLSHTITLGNKPTQLTEEWMRWGERPTYDGIVFAPNESPAPRFYNLWQGFSVEPAVDTEHSAVAQWLEHLRQNVCQGDEKLAHWLTGYFAHLVQRPNEKPLVALVFKGAKGVGKNALVSCVGGLLGAHYLLAASRRYLVGNFNGHLENLLLFVLDEAFWSGDKQAEGTLKDLVTGERHLIEHKGEKPYTVRNLARVVIIGNEEWLVPATHDERRFAVFNVSDGRKQDRDYFARLREGMRSGNGAAALLRYLLDYDLSGVDVNAAPASDGLLEQKIASLIPLEKWWFECLHEGCLIGSEFGDNWPEKVQAARLSEAYRLWLRNKNISVRVPTQFGKELHKFAPSVEYKTARLKRTIGDVSAQDGVTKCYVLKPLDAHRSEWDKYIGQPTKWEQQ